MTEIKCIPNHIPMHYSKLLCSINSELCSLWKLRLEDVHFMYHLFNTRFVHLTPSFAYVVEERCVFQVPILDESTPADETSYRRLFVIKNSVYSAKASSVTLHAFDVIWHRQWNSLNLCVQIVDILSDITSHLVSLESLFTNKMNHLHLHTGS